MSNLLQKSDALRVVLEMIVYAKEKGMMDHKEARDLFQKALLEAETKLESQHRPVYRDA